jgi:hypothetical protein
VCVCVCVWCVCGVWCVVSGQYYEYIEDVRVPILDVEGTQLRVPFSKSSMESIVTRTFRRTTARCKRNVKKQIINFIYCIVSFQQSTTLANTTVNSLKMVY